MNQDNNGRAGWALLMLAFILAVIGIQAQSIGSIAGGPFMNVLMFGGCAVFAICGCVLIYRSVS